MYGMPVLTPQLRPCKASRVPVTSAVSISMSVSCGMIRTGGVDPERVRLEVLSKDQNRGH